MKRNKRIGTILLCLLMITVLLPVQAFAAGKIDVEADCTLTISYTNNETPLVGAQFDLYQVASANEYQEFALVETFAEYPVSIDGLDSAGWWELASTLEGYVQRDDIVPLDSGTTDEQGLLSFPKQQETLKPGLYLVLGHSLVQGRRIYTPQPFMVVLPDLDEQVNAWGYDVTAIPKHDSRPKPSNPSDDSITRKVLKVWEDEGHEEDRPQEIVVQLLRNGDVFDTQTLNADTNWRYTWDDLDADDTWTVVEQEPDGYTVSVTREGITFVVTNTYDDVDPNIPTPPDPPTQPDDPVTPDSPEEPGPEVPATLPQTGQFWWPVPLLIAAGLLLVLAGLIRRRGANHET